MSLYQLERDRNLNELVETLQQSDNPSIRYRAAEIIGGLFESDDIKSARLSMNSEQTGELTIGAERGEFGETESAVDVLVSVVCEDDDDRVRAAAIDAIDTHGQEALEQVVTALSDKELEGASDWVTARAFADVIEDPQPELRMAAATGLGRVGDSSVTEPLIDRLGDSDPRVRTRSAVACGRIRDPRAVEPLEKRVQIDPNVDVRKAAVEALGEIKTQGSLAVLLEAADDPNESIRHVIADALGMFGSVSPVETLGGYLSDTSEPVRRTAMFSMVEILSNAPAQQSHSIRERTAKTLEAATAAEVIPPLAEILRDSSGTPQRRNAAWLLGQVTGTENHDIARRALIDALNAEDMMTAQFAATSLTEIDTPQLESELLALVRDRDAGEAARSKALFVLGKVGTERTQTALGEFVDQTQSETLRQQAFSALSKLGGIGGSERP